MNRVNQRSTKLIMQGGDHRKGEKWVREIYANMCEQFETVASAPAEEARSSSSVITHHSAFKTSVTRFSLIKARTLKQENVG